MNIEDDKCALCGKKLKYFDKHEHFNIGERIPYETDAPRPLFCSDRCLYWAGKMQVKNLSPREPLSFDEWDESTTEVYVVDGVVQKHRTYEDYVAYFKHWETKGATYHLEAMRANLRKFREEWLQKRAEAETQRIREEQEALQEKLDAEEEKRLRMEEEQARIEQEEMLQQEIAAMHAELALSLPYDVRYDGVSISGGTGAGKTHLKQELIIHNLYQDNPPGMIVIDPKGFMVKRLARLDCFNPDNGWLNHRLVVVDASTAPYPALNLFADTARNQAQRELLFTHAISTYRYIFSSGGFELTPKQTNCFGYCGALMFQMGGTLSDLVALLRKGGEQNPRVQAAIRRLPPTHRPFFEQDFSGSSYAQTRDEIITRLNQLMIVPAFVGMFDQPQRKIDLFDCIQKRKIVLINTGIDKSPVTSQMIGRLFISMLLNAVYMRASLPESQWHPVMFYCDEFTRFCDDDRSHELFNMVREYNVGVTVAFQSIYDPKISDALRSTISTNTRTKFAYNPKGRDLAYISSDFGCKPELFAQYPKTKEFARFICMVTGMTPPTPVTVPWGNVAMEPQMTEEQARWVWGYGMQQMAPDIMEKPAAPKIAGPTTVARAPTPRIKRVTPEDDPDYFPRA